VPVGAADEDVQGHSDAVLPANLVCHGYPPTRQVVYSGYYALGRTGNPPKRTVVPKVARSRLHGQLREVAERHLPVLAKALAKAYLAIFSNSKIQLIFEVAED
jgi:hypothetical protein